MTTTKQELKSLLGKRIAVIRKLNSEELESMGWENTPHRTGNVIVLDDGTFLIPSRDAEMNDMGQLLMLAQDAGDVIYV